MLPDEVLVWLLRAAMCLGIAFAVVFLVLSALGFYVLVFT